MRVNATSAFDIELLTVKEFTSVSLSKEEEIEWLLKAIALLDLTTLAGDDTVTNVHRLCSKAKRPLSACIAERLTSVHDWDLTDLRTAAVCVYPNQVKICRQFFNEIGSVDFPVASVAAGFPSGQYPLETRLSEIIIAVNDGSSEIDTVINRTLALQKNWKAVYNEVCAMRAACGDKVRLKTILATGELGSYENVYAASMVCMLAGADFIKTSTGKEAVNATLPVSLVMLRAIRDFYDVYGIKVGFKPAGGLRTAADAVNYLALVLNYMGPEWVQPEFLRFGASSLLGNIESRLYMLLNNGYQPLPGCLDYM
ncbi:unnamed protein product [Dicrocoelium dendriticum]|nr:unnamed protein product [Dicrocoelium dendriticum]